MWRRIFALFFRSLRVDARSIWVHASWFFLLVVIYVALGFAQYQATMFGAPGRDFFRSVIYLNAIFVTLLGTSYFSSAISEERELDTLGLMLMAGISPIGILLGKSTTRLFQILLLLALQYPFTLLALTLGGLLPDQIYAAYAALFAYTMLLANVGLLASVVSRRNRDAAGLTTLWVIGYSVTPIIAYALYSHSTSPDRGNWGESKWYLDTLKSWEPVLLWVSKTNAFGEFAVVTETGYVFDWTPQLISNSIAGVILFLLSCWLFPLMSHEPASEATTRQMVSRGTGRLKIFGTGRTWNGGLIWKDFHFIAGGWMGLVIRCVLYSGLYWGSFAIMMPWQAQNSTWAPSWRDITYGFQIFLVPLFALDCAMCMARVFNDEVRHQTLAALLMLPRSVTDVVYSKLLGCFIGLIPGMIALFVGYFVLQGSTETLNEIFKHTQAISMVIFFLSILLFAIHLCALLSLHMRWGAFAVSLGITLGVSMILGIIMETIQFRLRFGNSPYWETLPALGALPLIAFCGLSHLLILVRLPALGEK